MSKKDETKNSPESSDGSSKQDPRRSLLKKLAVGGVAGAALPSQWSKPVIDSVILPAHAQTTSGSVTAGGGGSSGPGPAPQRSSGESLMDFFVSPASAAEEVEDYCVQINIAFDVDPQTQARTNTGVTVTRVCFNACKPGLRWEDRNISPKALGGSGTNWAGTVAGFLLTLTNVNSAAAKVADADYGGIAGEILAGEQCVCDCSIAQ